MSIHQIILKGINEQLFLNNYLVVPGFGGFILKDNPSHFSASGGMLMPPSKTVSFNSQLKQNDGILALWLQSNLPCNNSEALNHLIEFAGYCKSVLSTKGRITINELGFFYTDLENNICFEPQQQINFLTSSFGLSPVSVKEIDADVNIEENKDSVFVDRLITGLENKIEERSILVSKTRSYKRMAIVSLSLLILFSGIFFIVSNSKLGGQLRSSIFGNEKNRSYIPLIYPEINLKNLTAEKKDYVADANGVASIEIDENKTIAVQALENSDPDGEINNHPRNNFTRVGHKNFEIVLGCFSVFSNAKRMVKKLKSLQIIADLSELNKKGFYVVSNGNFNTKEDALAQLPQIKSTCPNAWIKKGDD